MKKINNTFYNYIFSGMRLWYSTFFLIRKRFFVRVESIPRNEDG